MTKYKEINSMHKTLNKVLTKKYGRETLKITYSSPVQLCTKYGLTEAE
jgi:hypothetical protein